MSYRGYALLEVLVAIALLGIAAGALTEALLLAHRAERVGSHWMQAVSLAEQALERARLTQTGGVDAPDGFRRSWAIGPADGDLRLARIEVTVEWDFPAPGQLRLATLVRR